MRLYQNNYFVSRWCVILATFIDVYPSRTYGRGLAPLMTKKMRGGNLFFHHVLEKKHVWTCLARRRSQTLPVCTGGTDNYRVFVS